MLAHAVLGAAVAAAGGNDALAGALSAGGAEAVAPKVSTFLYGTADPEKLTAEQKRYRSQYYEFGWGRCGRGCR